MTRRRKIPVFAAALLAAGALASAAAKKPESKEPFFHQFLIPGDPLDDNLLAQEKRVAEDPESAALRNDFGNLLAERRFPKEARAEYRKALELDKTFFLAAYNLGLMEETEGRVDAAISAYREAIDRRRGFPQAHFRLDASTRSSVGPTTPSTSTRKPSGSTIRSATRGEIRSSSTPA